MEPGYLTLIIIFCINELVTAGIVFYLIREKSNQKTQADTLRAIIYENYRNNSK